MKNKIIFYNKKNKLKLTKEVINIMNNFRQLTDEDEAGGILIGSYLIKTENIIIDNLTIPQKYDQRSRYQYYRDERCHSDILMEISKISDSTSFYLGEWHTHPEEHPIPSGEDLKNWKKLLKKTKSYGNFLFFIIVGTSELSIWLGERNTFKIKKITY